MLYTFSHTKRQQSRLPLTINLAGYHHLQEPVVRNQSFRLFQWIYCEDGTGELILKGQKRILYPGQMALIYPMEPHEYRAVTEEWHVHIIGFSGSCCYELMKSFRMHESGIYHFHNPAIFYSCFQKIMEIRKQITELSYLSNSKGKNPPHTQQLVLLSRICYEFLLDLSLEAKYVSSAAPSSGNETIRALINYMEEHFREPISLDDLAAQVHLSKSYISQIFRKEMQQTILQYLTNLRISEARILLNENPDLRAAEIGRLCGFENPSYFGETFKKMMGMTPQEYRMKR